MRDLTEKDKLAIFLMMASSVVTTTSIDNLKNTDEYRHQLKFHLNKAQDLLKGIVAATSPEYVGEEDGNTIDETGIEFVNKIQDCLTYLFSAKTFEEKTLRFCDLSKLLDIWLTEGVKFVPQNAENIHENHH